MKLTDLNTHDYISILMKGPWGFGKTVAAASFAKQGPVWISYWDKKGPIELVQFFKKHAPNLLRNIEYDVYGANNANEYLNKLFALAKDCKYTTVINDSLTMMTAGAVNWSLGFRDNKKQKDKDKIMPDFDEYKVETSLVTQALDICRMLPANIIWTCHPIPTTKIEGSGPSMRVSKVNSIVTYGAKVAGIVPGQFSEIYHFSKRTDWSSGASKTSYFVSTEQVGDEYAKSNLGLKAELDITDRLFYDVWREAIAKMEAENNKEEKSNEVESKPNPFANVTPTTPWKTS